MSEKISLDGSEGKDSQQSYEINTDNNYSENETEDVSTECDGKSDRSHTDYYSNSTNSDDVVVIQQIDNAVTKEKDFMHYTAVLNGDDDDDDDNGDCARRKPAASVHRNCCKLTVRCAV